MSRRSLAGWMLAVLAVVVSGSNADAQKPPALADVKGVVNLAYSGDGSLLLIDYRASGGKPDQSNASVGLWDAKTGQFKVAMDKVPRSCDRIAISPDGKKAAAIAVGSKELRVWNTMTGKVEESQTLPAWTGSIPNAPFLKFSSDNAYLYSVRDKQILEYKLGGKVRLLAAKLDVTFPDEMTFDVEGKRLITVKNIMGRMAADLKIYDVTKDGEVQKVALKNHVRALAVSPDGKTLALSYLSSSKDGPKLELWDAAAFKVNTTAKDSRKDFENYKTLVFSPDGKILAGVPILTKTTGTLLDLLDKDGKVTKEVKGKGYVLSLTFSPDGKTLAAILGDNSILFIDPATGETKKP